MPVCPQITPTVGERYPRKGKAVSDGRKGRSVLHCVEKIGPGGPIFIQAGEKDGAANGPRPDSQRPEMPAAQGLSELRRPLKYGATFGASALGAMP